MMIQGPRSLSSSLFSRCHEGWAGVKSTSKACGASQALGVPTRDGSFDHVYLMFVINKLPLFPKHLHTLSLIRVVAVPSQQPEKNPNCHGNQTQNIIITVKKKKKKEKIRNCDQFSGSCEQQNRKVLNERWDKTQHQFCCSENLILAHGPLNIFHLRRDKPGTPRLPVWSARLEEAYHINTTLRWCGSLVRNAKRWFSSVSKHTERVTESLTLVGRQQN